MKPGGKSMNLKTIGLTTAGGAIILLVSAQLMAKPELPPQGRPIPRDRQASNAATEGRVPAAPPRLAVAGTPAIRELFSPLVAPKAKKSDRTSPSLPGGNLKPPVLNLPKPQAVVVPKPPTSIAPPAPPAPTGPSLSDVQMLGMVQLDSETRVLLKRTSTGESRYFTQGEDAFGFKVEEIKETEVSLSRAGKTEKLAMSTAVAIEGPGGTSVASATPGFSGFRDRGDRGDRGDRRDRGDRGPGGNSGGGESSGFTTAQLFSLPTWSERLKKLEEIKATLEPERYERLKKFMQSRAEAEKK